MSTSLLIFLPTELLNSPSTIVKPIKNEYNDIPNIDQIEQELKEME